MVDDNMGSTVKRMNFGGGWFMTDNIIVKLDYVNQSYMGTAHTYMDGGGFSGVVIEAGISF